MPSEGDRLQWVDNILQRNLGWVAAAEAKIGPLLAISTGMLGVIAARVPRFNEWHPLGAILVVTASGLLLGSVLCLGFVLLPRIDGPRGSLVFFEGIASRERDEYVESLLARPTMDVIRDLARQCHRNAEIARTKHKYVRTAALLMLVALLPWLLAIAVLYSSPQRP